MTTTPRVPEPLWELPAAARRWWDQLWRLPAARGWTEADVPAVTRLVCLQTDRDVLASPRLLAEVRHLESRLLADVPSDDLDALLAAVRIDDA